jgi:RHS repeat-associated protein
VRIAMSRSGYASDNGLYWLLGDHLGSTSITANSDGTRKSELRFKAWGEVRWSYDSTNTGYQFQGQYSYAVNFGLLYFGARWLDPLLGRFAQADSIIPGAGNVLAWDRYAGLMANPVRYTDPSGHAICTDDGYCGKKAIPIGQEIKRYGITIEGEWSQKAQLEILIEISRIGGMLTRYIDGTLEEAFRKVFGNKRELTLSDEKKTGCNTSAGNIVCGAGTDSWITRSIGVGLITHEFGHIFNGVAGSFFTNRLAKTTISTRDEVFVGGYSIFTNRYTRTNLGYQTATFPDQQHPINMDNEGPTAGEDFADMFMNYIRNSFANNLAGEARSGWMFSALSDYFNIP